jgi:TolB-like protein
VLPFQNMSGDPEQEYFADGMVEEIITALSRIRWLFVIARNSTFTYKGRSIDVKQVGRELGVRYVLEGSVRKSGQRVRITGQLIDTVNGTHLWADRFDGSLEDVFELQDQVATALAGVIEPTLQVAEIRRSPDRPTNDLTAYDLYLRAIPLRLSRSRRGSSLHSTYSGARSNAIPIMPPLSEVRHFATCNSTSVAGARTLTGTGARGSIWRGGHFRSQMATQAFSLGLGTYLLTLARTSTPRSN